MTPSPDDHLDDDVLSAALDGDPPGTAEGAHLEGCLRCQARSDALGRAAALVAGPVPAPTSTARERAIRAALAAAPVAEVRPRTRRRPPAWLLPAAAVVALLAAVVALLPRASDESVDQLSDSAQPGDVTEGEEDAAVGGQESSDESSAAATESAVAPDLGPVEDAAALRLRLAETAGAEGRAARLRSACGPALRTARPELGRPERVATLTWQGVPAVVHTYPQAGDEALAVVSATDDCRVLAEVPFRR